MVPRSETASPTSTIIKMSNSDAPEQQITSAGEGDSTNDDSIKAAVREATKKTQERLAAYQKKQAEKQAAMSENKNLSKEAKQAESTVSRLQALVGESRRLTAKSKDLNASAAAIRKSSSATGPLADASSSSAASAAMPGLHRSVSCGPGSPNNKKMKNLGDILNSLNNPKMGGSSSSISYNGPDSSTNSKRRATMCDTASVGGVGKMAAGAKGKKLGELFKNLGPSDPKTGGGGAGFRRSATMNDASSVGGGGGRRSPTSHLTPGGGSLEKGKKLGAIFKSLNGSKSDLSGSISKLASGLDDDDVQKLKPLMKTKVSQSTLSRIEKQNSIEEEEEEEDQSTSQSEDYYDGELGKGNNSGGEQHSIFKLVNDNARSTAAEAAQQDMDGSMPFLEDILETPKPERPKVKVGGSAKKKKAGGKTTDDINVRRDKMSKKHAKQMGKSMSEISHSSSNDDQYQEDMDGSMPMLAPFETPQGAKPKLSAAMTKSALKGTKNNDMALQEESMNLSQIMRQTDMLIPDNAGSRSNNKDDHNNDSGQGSAGSHQSKNGLHNHRPSRRRSAGGKDDDNKSSSKSKNNSRKSSSKSTRRSSLSKNNNSDHKKNEELASRAINKYHRTGGQGSSTMDGLEVCEKTGEILNDVSAISEESSDADDSLQDSSGGSSHSRKSLGGSNHSKKSTRSTSGSMRRGRTTAVDSSNRRGVSRSVSRSRQRGVSRSVSRSASMRRNPRPSSRRTGGQGGADGNRSFREKRSSMGNDSFREKRSTMGNDSFREKRSSIGNGAKSDDNNNGSMRGDRMSMSCRDVGVSDRRARLRASVSGMRDSSMRDGRRRRSSVTNRRTSSRRNHQRRDDDDDGNASMVDLNESQQSTAEDILGALDVSEIKIVGEEEGKKSKMDASESTRTSIYDKPKPKQKRNSLAGLANLESTGPAKPPEGDDCDNNSVSDSIVSSNTTAKKSKVGKFARKVGRKLTMQGKKKKKGSAEDGDDQSDDEEEEEDEEEDVGLDQIAAEFDEEEKDIYEKSGSLHASFTKGDFSQAQALDDLDDEDDGGKKSKKHRGSVFGKIKKMAGGKKKKKKDKKAKGSEVLESDSESSEDELLGSEYSDNESEDEEEEEEDFVQLQINGERASVVTGSDRAADDPVLITPTKGRQRRVSVASGGRRQRGSIGQQQRSALQAALEAGSRTPLRGPGDEASVSTNARNRRARSLRGKVVRKGEGGGVPPRCKSLKEVPAREGGGRKIRRIKSVDFEGRMNNSSKMDYDHDDDSPAFDWAAYGEKKETSPPREAGAAGAGQPRRVRRVESRRRSQQQVSDKRMSGGLSKIIYASQPVTS